MEGCRNFNHFDGKGTSKSLFREIIDDNEDEKREALKMSFDVIRPNFLGIKDCTLDDRNRFFLGKGNEKKEFIIFAKEHEIALISLSDLEDKCQMVENFKPRDETNKKFKKALLALLTEEKEKANKKSISSVSADANGRILIPKFIIDELKIEPGQHLFLHGMLSSSVLYRKSPLAHLATINPLSLDEEYITPNTRKHKIDDVNRIFLGDKSLYRKQDVCLVFNNKSSLKLYLLKTLRSKFEQLIADDNDNLILSLSTGNIDAAKRLLSQIDEIYSKILNTGTVDSQCRFLIPEFIVNEYFADKSLFLQSSDSGLQLLPSDHKFF